MIERHETISSVAASLKGLVMREARGGALRSRRTSPPSLRGPRADVCTRHRSLGGSSAEAPHDGL